MIFWTTKTLTAFYNIVVRFGQNSRSAKFIMCGMIRMIDRLVLFDYKGKYIFRTFIAFNGSCFISH
jgi:hypothetical protein